MRPGGLRAGGPLLFEQILIDSDDEEASPALCREHYYEVLERGNSLASRVAQSGATTISDALPSLPPWPRSEAGRSRTQFIPTSSDATFRPNDTGREHSPTLMRLRPWFVRTLRTATSL